MDLPNCERVIYAHNPLVEVICQLRFPVILKIARQEPIDFQDQVRNTYPIFRTESSDQILAGVNLPSEIQSLIRRDPVYKFVSEEGTWSVSLNREFVALATTAYQRYEEFRERLVHIIRVLERNYSPSFYTRTGLRYQDLIVRSKLGILDKSWQDLIPVHMASEIHSPHAFADSVFTFLKTFNLTTDGGKINLRHGFVEYQETDNKSKEVAYLIDSDFYTDEKKKGEKEVTDVLDRFNRAAGNLFRWGITDVLHEAMEPKSAEQQNDR